MNKFPLTLIGLGAAALGLVAAIKFSLVGGGATQLESKPGAQQIIQQQYKTILLYPKLKLLPEFSLYDQNARPFERNSFSKKVNLIFSGYTNCPDVCPTTLNDLNRLYTALPENIREKLQIILFSVDPERDTPDKLKKYLSFFNDDFIGISGDKFNIDKLAHALGAVYQLNKDEGEFYSVDHSARLFLVDEQGRRLGLINSQELTGENSHVLIDELSALIRTYK